MGQSSGGIAALNWVNYIKNKARAETIALIVDSSFLLDAPTIKGTYYLRSYLTNLLKLTNTEVTLPQTACYAAFS